MSHLIESANYSLFQLKSFLLQLNEQQYTTQLPIFSGSTIGMHVRHVIEFYQCLVKGIIDGKMDYDARERSLLQESNIDYSISCIENLLIELSMIKENKNIILLTEQNLHENKLEIESNIYRELSYVIEHTVHHFAIIKMGCTSAFENIVFEKDFGVAYSTIKYRESVYSNLSA